VEEKQVEMFQPITGGKAFVPESLIEDYVGWGWLRAEDAKPGSAEKPVKAKQ
jgi:hypothetical protein